jgi:hypothetical protein
MGHTFQLLHTFDIKLCTNTKFKKIFDVNKKIDKIPEE